MRTTYHDVTWWDISTCMTSSTTDLCFIDKWITMLRGRTYMCIKTHLSLARNLSFWVVIIYDSKDCQFPLRNLSSQRDNVSRNSYYSERMLIEQKLVFSLMLNAWIWSLKVWSSRDCSKLFTLMNYWFYMKPPAGNRGTKWWMSDSRCLQKNVLTVGIYRHI